MERTVVRTETGWSLGSGLWLVALLVWGGGGGGAAGVC